MQASTLPPQNASSFSRLDLDVSRAKNRSSAAGMPMEESSKLNMLIDEYRRENDRCSKRINELQRKLNATSNRK